MAADRRRLAAGLFLGVGIALIALATSGTRPGGQRVLYLIAGLMFLLAAVLRLRRTQKPDSGP